MSKSLSCAAAMRPSATTSWHGNKSEKALSTGIPEDCSELVGVLVLNMPRCGLNECHGNAFQRTNSSGFKPSCKSVPHTIVAVGSEEPFGHLSGLLVRRGLIPEMICSGGLRPPCLSYPEDFDAHRAPLQLMSVFRAGFARRSWGFR